MSFKIELRYFTGWDDAGWTDADDDGERPSRFGDRDLAATALAEFFDEVRVAVRQGNMEVEQIKGDVNRLKGT